MSKLVIFGDSFASYRNSDSHQKAKDSKGVLWFEEVAKKLNLPFITRACAGSSFEFSKNQFWKYYNSDEYSPNDLIIFVYTSFQRSPLLAKDLPAQYASYYAAWLQGTLSKTHFAYNHYNDNKELYKSLTKYYDIDTQYCDRNLFCLALKQIPNMTVVITAFKDLTMGLKDVSLLKDADNFIYIPGNLFELSENELINADYKKFNDFFGGELRNCHLSNSNNMILADQITQCIQHKTNKYFRKDKFKKKFIKLENIDQRQELPYLEYDESKDYF